MSVRSRKVGVSSGSSLLLLVIMSGAFVCGPKPIPPDKTAFVGEWSTRSGFTLWLNANGKARLFQPLERASPDFDSIGIKVAPPVTEELRVQFVAPNRLDIWKTMLYGKRYRVDRPPYQDGDSVRMVLNGVTFTRR